MAVEAFKQQKANTAIRIPSFGLTGEISSGKSTYADHLKTGIEVEMGINLYRPSFSSKITEIARDLFDMEGKDRVLLGEIGLKMREIDPHVWTKYVIKDIRKNNKLPFAVDGLRFIHDVELFKQNFEDFVMIRIDAEEKQRFEAYKKTYGKYPTKEELKNKGEGDITKLPFDIRLVNNYERAELESQIQDVIGSIRKGTIWDLLRK